MLAGPAALYLFAFSIQRLGVARAAVFPAAVPALTILTGWLLLGEPPTALQAAGLVTVLADLSGATAEIANVIPSLRAQRSNPVLELPRADLIDFNSFFENKVESEIEQRPMNIALRCSPDDAAISGRLALSIFAPLIRAARYSPTCKPRRAVNLLLRTNARRFLDSNSFFENKMELEIEQSRCVDRLLSRGYAQAIPRRRESGPGCRSRSSGLLSFRDYSPRARALSAGMRLAVVAAIRSRRCAVGAEAGAEHHQGPLAWLFAGRPVRCRFAAGGALR